MGKAPIKVRADQLLVQQGLASSRTQAQGLILSGVVFHDQHRVEKAGQPFLPTARLTLKESPRFVSRGGIKLDHALGVFKIDPTGWTVLDAGASTGGFTDALLQRGAARIYAVDVGYGQCHQKLRGDPRVILLEKTNVRYLDCREVPDRCDLIVADLSFISLTKVLPRLVEFVKPGGFLIVLVKPQFELGPKEAKKGVVRSPELQSQAVKKVMEVASSLSLEKLGEVPSPIRGPKGNQEQFLYLRKSSKSVES